MANYANKVLKNGKPIPGVLVRLYNEENVLCGSASTNWQGRYAFYDITPGNYQIRFFGENFTEDSWLYITVTGTDEGAIPIKFAGGAPNLGVSEFVPGEWEVTGGEKTTGQFSFTNLTTSEGSIRTIWLEKKLSSEDESEWEDYKTLNFDSSMDQVADNLSSATYISTLELVEKPTVYDFRCSFFNGNGRPALDGSDIIYAKDSSIIFNGIDDFLEYVGVNGVEVKNEKVTASGISQLPTNEIILEWNDPRDDPGGTMYYNAAGKLAYPTQDQTYNLTGYVVYMFVSDSGDPPSAGNHPVPNEGETETNGAWYFLTSAGKDTPYVTIRVPEKKKIMLWVGFKTAGTVTEAPEDQYVFGEL